MTCQTVYKKKESNEGDEKHREGDNVALNKEQNMKK